MKCPACGTEVKDHNRFCTQCGQKLPEVKVDNCVKCGEPLVQGAQFCANCGTPVRTEAAQAPAAEKAAVMGGGATRAVGAVSEKPVTGGETERLPSHLQTISQPQLYGQQSMVYQSPAAPKPGSQDKRRLFKIGVLALGAVLLIFAALMVFRGSGIDLGEAQVKAGPPANLVQTTAWGEVPANQVLVVMKDGYGRKDADELAASLGGQVVGWLEYLNLFQIETGGKTAEELQQAIARAKQDPRVELAAPNQQIHPDTVIHGVRCDAMDTYVYNEENRGKGYEIVGVQRAWDLLKVSGIKPGKVHVGIVDDGLYKGKDEFSGKVKVNFTAPEDELKTEQADKEGRPLSYSSHGTGVATILAADSDNGGTAGIASVLGDNLSLTVVNKFTSSLGGYIETTPDPNDPAKFVWKDGKAYAIGSLVAIKKAIESGATIINCSWGNSNADPDLVKIYRKFFEKMAAEHKEVLFVCSAGNDGKVIDGTRRIPSGLNLPNMITVGNIMNDGKRCPSSNMSSPNYEVTLAAPGQQSVQGIGRDGSIENDYGGTSMAAPHVAAAAAMIRALNPKLSAGDIKKILVENAAPGVNNENYSVPAPKELGGRVLAIDKALLKVINDLRAQKGEPPLSFEGALAPARIDLTADGGPREYTITAGIPGVGKGGTDVTIELQGPGSIGGLSRQHLDSDGQLTWKVILSGDSGTVHVKRLDSGACWNVKLPPDLSGTWTGSFKVEDFEASEGLKLAFRETKLTVVFNERRDSTEPLTGTARLEASYAAKIKGTLNGRRITFRIIDDPANVFFVGEIVGGAIEGTWDGHQESGNMYLRAAGTWYLKRQQ